MVRAFASGSLAMNGRAPAEGPAYAYAFLASLRMMTSSEYFTPLPL